MKKIIKTWKHKINNKIKIKRIVFISIKVKVKVIATVIVIDKVKDRFKSSACNGNNAFKYSKNKNMQNKQN
jgi:hypothetical protein